MDTKTAPYAGLILRLALGTMFIAHGLTKLLIFTLPGTAAFFTKVGFPGWLAYPTTFAEIFGGIMLIIGFYPRLVAAALIPLLIGATTVHLANGWGFGNPGGGWEYPVFLVFAVLVQALLGDGAFAIKTSPTFGKR